MFSKSCLFQENGSLTHAKIFGRFDTLHKVTPRVLIFHSSFAKPSLKICLVTPKEGLVTLRVAGLAVRGCKGLSTMARRSTYAVLSRNQFCRELRAHGRGGSQKVTSDDEGEGGGSQYPPKMMTSFMNSP